MSEVDPLFSGADTGSQELSPPRTYAPMPKRRRGNRSEDGDSVLSLSPLVMPREFTNSELSRAAKELLLQYEYEPATSASHLDPQERGKTSPRRQHLQPQMVDDIFAGSARRRYMMDAASASNDREVDEHDCNYDGCYEYRTSYVVDDDRLSDDYTARGGGKKRKVPASAQQGPLSGLEREDQSCGHSCGHTCGHTCGHSCSDFADDGEDVDGSSLPDHDPGCPHSDYCEYHSAHRTLREGLHKPPHRRMTPIRRAVAFEKRLLKARKAQILGLHADAEAWITAQKQKLSQVPTKGELEELSEALEFAGVTAWEGDRVGIGAGIWEGQGVRTKSFPDLLEGLQPGKQKWKRRGRALERYQWLHRQPVKRMGWIPEGSFEYEMKSPVSAALTRADKQLSLLRSKVTYLLTLTLTSPVAAATKALANPVPSKSEKATASTTQNKSASTTRKPAAVSPNAQPVKPTVQASQPVDSFVADAGKVQAPVPASEKSSVSENVTVEPTVDDPDFVPSTSKKGKKKKKRSAIANAANPHHVKNYVPSRRPAPPPSRDSLTLPDMLNLLFFPPPTRFLNARPGKPGSANVGTDQLGSSASDAPEGTTQPTDVANDEYICCFCEYDLFFGSAASLDKGIRRRKKLLERREKVHEKAKGVVDGKGLGQGTKKQQKVESDCEGGDACRCAEIRANRKAKKGKKKNKDDRAAPMTDDTVLVETSAEQHGRDTTTKALDTPPADLADVMPDVKTYEAPVGSKPTASKQRKNPAARTRSRSPPDTITSAASGSSANLE